MSIKRYFAAFAFAFVISFYWVGKLPSNFSGIYLPDFSFIFFLFLAFAGLLQMFLSKISLRRDELFFSILLVSVPLYGNMAEYIFGATASPNWSAYVDVDRLDVNNLLGFRSFILSVVIFLFSARYLASLLNTKLFLIALLVGSMPHILWGVAQVMYVFNPRLIDILPIKVGQECNIDFCLNIVRATGLMGDPFAFSWLFLVIGLSFVLISKSQVKLIVAIIVSFLSISRSFILASIPLLIFSIISRKMILFASLFVFSCFVLLVGYNALELLSVRFDGDISKESRLATNSLAIHEMLNGNLMGVGFSHSYFTDSTVASLLLSSGLPGLLSYFGAWFFFFRSFWVISGKRIEIILFGAAFVVSSLLVGSVEAQPGLFVLFVLYWFSLFALQRSQKLTSRRLP